MLDRITISAFARKAAPLVAALMMTCGAAAAAEGGKYPDWKGQWERQRVPGVGGQPSFDPNNFSDGISQAEWKMLSGNDHLPLTPVPLPDPVWTWFMFSDIVDDNQVEFEGRLTSLTCTAGCAPTAVPEPLTMTLLGAGLGVLAWRHIRSRRRDLMTVTVRSTIARSLMLTALLIVGAAPTAHAVDGVVLIDQNRALAGGVTPGDAPGFPVVINTPGIYKLASNLVVPNENTTAIQINVDNVTIDEQLASRIIFPPEVQKSFMVQDQEYLAKNDPQLQEWWNKVFKA